MLKVDSSAWWAFGLRVRAPLNEGTVRRVSLLLDDAPLDDKVPSKVNSVSPAGFLRRNI